MLKWYLNLNLYLQNMLEREEGQDLIEYALLLGLITVVAILAITTLGARVGVTWTTISDALVGALPGP